MCDAEQSTLISVGGACCHSEKISEQRASEPRLEEAGRDTMLLELGGVEKFGILGLLCLFKNVFLFEIH